MKKLLIMALTCLLGACASTDRVDDVYVVEMTNQAAAQHVVLAMAAANSYHNPKRKGPFRLDLLGWQLVDLNGQKTNLPTRQDGAGLAYDILQHVDGVRTIFALRGTDTIIDYPSASLGVGPFSGQYSQSDTEFAAYRAKNPTRQIQLAGHSLGGGLALHLSVKTGVPAVVFDPSPRIFDGLGDHHEPAVRVAIFENHEPLQLVRKFWKKKFESVISPGMLYRSTDDFSIFLPPTAGGGGAQEPSKHRSDLLALALLKRAVLVDASLRPVLDAVQPPK